MTDRRPCWACGKRAFWGARFGWLCPEHAQAAHDSDRDDADADRPKPDLPRTVAGRMECVSEWLAGPVIVDDNGEPTGERGAPLITREQSMRLMEVPDISEAFAVPLPPPHRPTRHQVFEDEWTGVDLMPSERLARTISIASYNSAVKMPDLEIVTGPPCGVLVRASEDGERWEYVWSSSGLYPCSRCRQPMEDGGAHVCVAPDGADR